MQNLLEKNATLWFERASNIEFKQLELSGADDFVQNIFGVERSKVFLKSIWVLGPHSYTTTQRRQPTRTPFHICNNVILNTIDTNIHYISGTTSSPHNAFYRYEGIERLPNCALRYSTNVWGLADAFESLVFIAPFAATATLTPQDTAYLGYLKAMLKTLVDKFAEVVLVYDSSKPEFSREVICEQLGVSSKNPKIDVGGNKTTLYMRDVSSSTFHQDIGDILYAYMNDPVRVAQLLRDIRFLDSLVAAPQFETFILSNRKRCRFGSPLLDTTSTNQAVSKSAQLAECTFVSQSPVSVLLFQEVCKELGQRVANYLAVGATRTQLFKTYMELAERLAPLLSAFEFKRSVGDSENHLYFSAPKTLKVNSLAPFLEPYGIDLNALINNPQYDPMVANPISSILLCVYFDIVATYAEFCNALSLLTERTPAYNVDWSAKRIYLVGQGFQLLSPLQLVMLRNGFLTNVDMSSRKREPFSGLEQPHGDSATAVGINPFADNLYAESTKHEFPKACLIGVQAPNALGFYNMSSSTNILTLVGAKSKTEINHDGWRHIQAVTNKLQKGSSISDLPSFVEVEKLTTQPLTPLLTPTQTSVLYVKERPFEANAIWHQAPLFDTSSADPLGVNTAEALLKSFLGLPAQATLIQDSDFSANNRPQLLELLELFNRQMFSMGFFVHTTEGKGRGGE